LPDAPPTTHASRSGGPPPLQALIFDVDGTLAETEELHRRAFNDTFTAAGLGWHWSRANYRRLLKTTGGKERMAVYLAERGEDLTRFDLAALHRDKTARYGALMGQGGLALRPGIGELIAEARAAGLRLAIATTTNRPNVDALCAACFNAPADQIFDVIAAGDEVAAKKPAPDVFRLALSRLRLPAASCLAVEDSRNGLHSAQAAGLAVLVTPSVFTDDDDFTGALRVLPDLATLGGMSGLHALWKD